MKKVTIIISLLLTAWAGKAQNANGIGEQNANLEMSNALEISFTSNTNAVNMEFTSLNDMVNGIETATHEIKVRSNKKFRVTVKPASNTFTYSGLALIGSLLQVSSVMKIQVGNNNTGGDRPWLAQIFGWQSFSSLGLPVTLLTDCDAGGNQTFTVKYKATPGISVTSGNYTAEMVYTATQE